LGFGTAPIRSPAQTFASHKLPCPPMTAPRRWIAVHFDQIDPVHCPCGTSQRALAHVPEFPGTIHRTQIHADAQPHFHRRLTETYYILQCDSGAELELDGERIAVQPGMCIVIPAGVVHRAVGRMTILNIVVPKFDPADEVLVPALPRTSTPQQPVPSQE